MLWGAIPEKWLDNEESGNQRPVNVDVKAQAKAHLDAVALVNGDGGNHTSDLHLHARAVDELAGGHQVFKQDAQPLARVHRQCVHLALHLQEPMLVVGML